MALIRWDPFDLMTTWDREFQDMLSRAMSTRQGIKEGWNWQPRSEVFRDGDQLVVRVELPGVDPEKDIEVDIEGNVLHIKGQRSFGREVKKEDVYLAERAFGSFSRDLALPDGVEADKLVANYDSGVLQITMPLPGSLGPQTRRVPIGVSTGQAAVEAGQHEVVDTTGSEAGDE